MIDKSTIEEIKARSDLVTVVESYGVQLRKSGRNYAGLCPFHENSKTPAFSVNHERQTWRCFGSCGVGGDVIAFVQRQERCNFHTALELLGNKCGVQLSVRPKSPEVKKRDELLTESADYFHQLLLSAPQAEAARQYVRSRGLLRRSVKGFKLGYSLPSWNDCLQHFTRKGYTVDDLLSTGLAAKGEKGGVYDRFRNRLMFPICLTSGQVVGFGARTLEPDGVPKYLNSPQSKHFDKSRLLYGLNFARQGMRRTGEVIIVEGYMDAIRSHEAGFSNTVATMGTALSADQLHIVARASHRIVIALDADEAGSAAAMRVIEMAQRLISAESNIDADIYIATMPEGSDPDDVISNDPQQFALLIVDAQTVVDYVLEHLTSGTDLSSIKLKRDIAAKMRPLIMSVRDLVERDGYWRLLADRLNVSYDALVSG